TPLKMLDDCEYARSICSDPVITGSKLVIGAPMPSVELTNPLVPVPTPPAAGLVPPDPDPTVPLKPPTPPPGVFCTIPVLTPSTFDPACERRISVSAIFKL